MIRLLREDRLATEFGKLRRKSKSLSFAAPFWGLGAAKTLGLKAGDKVRVLCRFESVACNPSALLELALLGASIRSHRRLHAKMYIGDAIVVVGSSNPSKYGLTQEGDVVGGTAEANIITDEPDVVYSVATLFQELWDDEDETIPVTAAMIRKEIKRRELNPPPPVRRQLSSRRLLAACREAPELFSSVVVCPYDDDLGVAETSVGRER
jgi:phosphatidylserine/phosphatidylglycerophosphate/cardiolipin synthase-like enzyme